MPVGRRFRAADVALHLDMAVIGDVCVAISLSGYRSVLNGFLDDSSGSQRALLAALDTGQTGSVADLAHAVLGSAASLGLRAVGQQAERIENGGAHLQPADCAQHAAGLRAQLATARALLQRMGFA
jgi:HPt (histidine-containing phosphotransfer) domain-containing protein